MKGKITVFAALVLCISAILCLSSCDYTFGHNYSEDYSYDDDGHWFACTGVNCDAKKSYEDHVLVDGYVEAEGKTYVGLVCTVCDYGRVTTEIEVALDENSFKNAIAAGGEVLLGESVTVESAIEIPEGVKVVLDLGGNTVDAELQPDTNDKHCYAINNRGTLVITNGTINARGVQNYGTMIIEEGVTINALDTNGGAAIWNYEGGTVTVNGGTFTSAFNSGFGAGAVNNSGTITLNGGTFDSNSWTYAVINKSGAKMTVNDGVVVTGNNGAISSEGGELTINGGSFSHIGTDATTGHVVYVTGGTTVINGGVFEHKGTNLNGYIIWGAADVVVKDGEFIVGGNTYGIRILNETFIVEGGDFSSVSEFTVLGGVVSITGGIYGLDVTDYAASGYSAVDNGNGTWTVKLVPVADTTELSSALASGVSNVALPTGTYTIPENFTSDTLTVVGAGEGTELNTKTTGQYVSYHGKDINFTNLTIKGQSSGQYNGFAHVSDLVFEDCVIDGTLTLYGESATFINCTFNLPAGCYIWTWGVGEATFDGCTFNTAGKAILMYGEKVTTVLTVKNCTFNATQGDKAGAITNQNCAAIEIDSTLVNRGLTGEARVNRYTLITENNKYSDNFSGEWRIKGTDEFDITVNSKQYGVLTLDGVEYEYVTGTKDVQLKAVE